MLLFSSFSCCPRTFASWTWTNFWTNGEKSMSHHAICPTCLSNFQSFDENPQNLSNFTGPVGVGFGCRQPLFLTFVCRVDAAKQEDERQRRATSRTTSSIAPFAPFTQTALCVVETDSCVVSFICPIPTCARPKDQFGQKSIWTSACPKICPSPICTSSLKQEKKAKKEQVLEMKKCLWVFTCFSCSSFVHF